MAIYPTSAPEPLDLGVSDPVVGTSFGNMFVALGRRHFAHFQVVRLGTGDYDPSAMSTTLLYLQDDLEVLGRVGNRLSFYEDGEWLFHPGGSLGIGESTAPDVGPTGVTCNLSEGWGATATFFWRPGPEPVIVLRAITHDDSQVVVPQIGASGYVEVLPPQGWKPNSWPHTARLVKVGENRALLTYVYVDSDAGIDDLIVHECVWNGSDWTVGPGKVAYRDPTGTGIQPGETLYHQRTQTTVLIFTLYDQQTFNPWSRIISLNASYDPVSNLPFAREGLYLDQSTVSACSLGRSAVLASHHDDGWPQSTTGHVELTSYRVGSDGSLTPRGVLQMPELAQGHFAPPLERAYWRQDGAFLLDHGEEGWANLHVRLMSGSPERYGVAIYEIDGRADGPRIESETALPTPQVSSAVWSPGNPYYYEGAFPHAERGLTGYQSILTVEGRPDLLVSGWIGRLYARSPDGSTSHLPPHLATMMWRVQLRRQHVPTDINGRLRSRATKFKVV